MNPYQDEMDNLIELLYHLYPNSQAIRQRYGNSDRFKAYKLLDSSLSLYHCPLSDRAIHEARAIRSRALKVYLGSCVEPLSRFSPKMKERLASLTISELKWWLYNNPFGFSHNVMNGFNLILRYLDLNFLSEEEALEEARQFGQKVLYL